MEEPLPETRGWRDLAWPLAVYAVVLFPFCAAFLLFYPDERFYLDASIAMYQTGDVMVPRFDDGTPRLNKPVLTYWIMLASYHVFGLNLLAARLPFLLAGAGVLCLTYRLAWLIAGQRRVAQFAVWIMLANPLFWLSCMRCLPDIFLALFALMAVHGYFALRCRNWRDARAAWWLFTGIGLAFAAKGLPAVLLMGCIGLHAIMWKRDNPLALTKTMVVPFLAGTLIGVLGFAPILWNHAHETAAVIWRDQFASRLAGRTWGMFYRTPLLLLTLAVLYLPWLLPSVLQKGRTFKVQLGALRPRTAWQSFLVLTGALWFGATVATENCSVRYLFPLFPWLAIALAELVAGCDADWLRRYSRGLVACLTALLLIVTAFGLVMAAQMSAYRWTVPELLLIAMLACGLAIWSRRGDAARRLHTACALGPIALLAGFLAAAPVLLPDLGTQVGRSFDALPLKTDAIAVLGTPCQVSRVRLALATVPAEVLRIEQAPATRLVLLVSQSQGTQLAQQDYELYPAARILERVSWRECLAAAGRGDLESFLQKEATVYCWAVRRERPAP